MQADKAAYERIISEKDHQISLLKEIIKKLEDSKSKDINYLQQEAFKIKQNQLECLESEKTAEKLSFLSIVEQLKGQVRLLEQALDGKTNEVGKIKSINQEKSKEIEALREKTKELNQELDEYKIKFEKNELKDDLLKERDLLQSQIKNLRNTIENQKVQIVKLYEKLEKRNES